MRSLGGFDCTNNEKKTVMNKDGICLVFEWRVRLALNSTVTFVSLSSWSSYWYVVDRGPSNLFLRQHVDSILNFTVTKQNQQGIQVS